MFSFFCAVLSLGERKIHSDCGYHRHWFVVQHCGLIAPLLYGVDGCLNQQRVTRNDLQVLDCSFLADFSFQNNNTLNARLFRERRVNRLNLRNQVCCNHVAADTNTLCSWRRWRWRWWRRWWCGVFLSLQDASKHTCQDTSPNSALNSCRRRSRLNNPGYFFRNLGGLHDRTWIDLYLFNDHRLRRGNLGWRRRRWWRRWWRSDEHRHQLRLRQFRIGNERNKNQDNNQHNVDYGRNQHRSTFLSLHLSAGLK